jgi:hypothetical protein
MKHIQNTEKIDNYDLHSSDVTDTYSSGRKTFSINQQESLLTHKTVKRESPCMASFCSLKVLPSEMDPAVIRLIR